ncbi:MULTISPECIES: MFS transporter [unclassified Bradyrhizobium]|uniref:MFS transporter n=1 Tax=unclassified Bradyrhizobium TaxID=2631580 RepID=UPI0028ED44C6|nr:MULTISPECIES: MFS transporter [unclassified Bradyrhizobium]
MSTRIILFLAMACGLIAANIYYAQPLAGPISSELRLSVEATGLIVTLTQIGYGTGLLLIVPLSDLVENRKVIVVMVGTVALGLVGAAAAPHALWFLASAFVVGLGSSAMQIIVPYAAHMAPDNERGRAVGIVMSGLLLGMMLARPVASAITQLSSWRMVFVVAASAMTLLAMLLRLNLPTRQPASDSRYFALLTSMWHLVLTIPALRRRTFYHACLFASFSLFWTTVPLLLTGPLFQLSQGAIALFALAGAGGVVAAPIAGHIADRGWTKPATAIAMSGVAIAFLIARAAMDGSNVSLGLLVVTGLVVDFGVAAHMIISQRVIFSLRPEYRGRLNGIYIATIFLGGAVGSAFGGWAYASGGWPLTCWLGFSFPIIAIATFATESNWLDLLGRARRFRTR